MSIKRISARLPKIIQTTLVALTASAATVFGSITCASPLEAAQVLIEARIVGTSKECDPFITLTLTRPCSPFSLSGSFELVDLGPPSNPFAIPFILDAGTFNLASSSTTNILAPPRLITTADESSLHKQWSCDPPY